MSKRKVSTERNTVAKDTTRRPSITSIHTRVTAVPPQTRLSRSGKSPSAERNLNQSTMTKLSKTMLATEGSNAAPPKTRFNSQDRCKELRSNSSPRLKSFPAERIRKFDNPALFDTKTRVIMGQANREHSGRFSVPVSSTHNHEYGDHIRGMYHGHQHQSQMPENIRQQQIYPNYSMHQPILQADGASTYRVHGPDRHRPNVPHGHQSHVNAMAAPSSLAYVQNGQTPVAQSSTPAVQVHAQQSQRIQDEATNSGVREQTDWINGEPTQVTDLEKQPVGGRNLVLHRRAVMQERQQQQQQQRMQTHSHPAMYSNATSQHTNRPISVPPSQNNIPVLPYLTNENPRQVYQQLQNNIVSQQQMQQRALNLQMQTMSGQQQTQGNQGTYYNYFTRQLPEKTSFPYGMTSPQDANVNQTRSGQHSVTAIQQMQQQNTAYPINQQSGTVPSNPIPVDNSNVRSQIRPYTINVVDSVEPQNVAHDHPGHNYGQVSQMYRPAIPGQAFPNQAQQPNIVPQNHVTEQVVTAENPGTRPNDQTHANRGRNNLKFSPKMIRDQELLVATMKQQGISDELMRRQFDVLLKEQRRQLEYLQQFYQESDLSNRRKQETRRKLQTDEKPEWMAHITPPRISYSEFEKMNSKIKEQNVVPPQQQVNENLLVNHDGMQQNANNQQLIPSSLHFRDQSQQNMYQNWQQQNSNWQQQPGIPPESQYTYTPSQPRQHQQHQQHQHQYLANNPTHSQYPTYWQHQQNIQQPYQQVNYQPPQQISWQRDQLQREEDSHYFKKVGSLNDLNAKNSEPSSLLKLRLYKDVIRPQKRNNGLQDPETIQKALETLNNPECQKGLEYLANLNRKKQIAKLDGMQNPNEVPADLIPRPLLDNSMMIPQRAISANGLENSRNPNNPLPQPTTYLKRSEVGGTMNEYPRQKQNNPRHRYSLMAEREDGTIAPTVQYQTSIPLTQAQQFNLLQQQNHQKVIPYNEKNPLSALNKSMPYKLDGSSPDHYHQMQHYHQNKQNMVNNNGQGDVPSLNKPDTYSAPYLDRPGGDTAGLSHFKDNGETQNKIAPYPPLGPSQRLNGSYNSPEIREAKIIGGVTYLARKPDYIPSRPLIPENTLTANKYVQPSIIYN